MATSKITIYRSEITPERNAWIENTHEYLVKNAIKTYEADNFQYQKIALNKTITIAADQEKVGNQTLGNYLELEQDNRSYFYFLIDCEWTSLNAVTLTVSLDTINTYGKDLQFLPQTTIQRQHEDRIKYYDPNDPDATDTSISDSKRLYRLIDKEPENITLPKELKASTRVYDDFGDLNWYLVYKTRDDLSPTNTANPIECDLLADQPLLIKKGTSDRGDVTLKAEQLQANTFYYIDTVNNPYVKWTTADHPERILTLTENQIYVFWKTNGDNINTRVWSYNKLEDGYSLKDSGQVLSSKVPMIFKTCNSLGMSSGSQLYEILNGYEDIVNLTRRYRIDAGEITDLKTKPFSDLDKTDTKLMKIIRLPYAPIEITKNSNGEYVFPESWSISNGMMRLKTNNLSAEFENNIKNIDISNLLKLNSKVTPNDAPNKELESKLYNSEFYTYKFVYDSFQKQINFEDIELTDYIGGPVNIKTSFKPTNTVNSKFAFKFDLDDTDISYKTTTDYEKYLLVNRNNEETIFSNDYINYIRNGYNYDKKAKDMSLAQGILGTVLGLGQAGAFLGLNRQQAIRDATSEFYSSGANRHGMKTHVAHDAASAAAYKEGWIHDRLKQKSGNFSGLSSVAAISAGFGAVNGIVSTVTDQINAQNSIDAKLQQLSQQSTNVSGADDVDLLQYYNGNKLDIMTYGLKPLANQNLYKLFTYAGYSHPVQDIPNMNSRYWYNYIQCSPIFQNEYTSVYSNYLDDIKIRFEKGVTKFHYHPEIKDSWNLDQDKENWETSVLDTSYLPTTKLELGLSGFSISSKNDTVKVSWNVDIPFDNNGETIELSYFDTNNILRVTTTTEANATSLIGIHVNKSKPVKLRRLAVWNSSLNSDYKELIIRG